MFANLKHRTMPMAKREISPNLGVRLKWLAIAQMALAFCGDCETTHNSGYCCFEKGNIMNTGLTQVSYKAQYTNPYLVSSITEGHISFDTTT
jgi:hypothetical protein